MAAHSLSLSLPTIITRSRVPLAPRHRLLLLPHRRVAAARDHARRGLASASSRPRSLRGLGGRPSRPRAAPLGHGVGAGRSWSGGRGHRAMSSSTNSTVAAELSMAEKSGGIEPLPFVHDKHGGVIIEMATPMDPAVFSASLKAALAKWREQGIRGVWIKLPIALSNLIPPVVEVLVVQEKSGVLRGLGVWKFPTGVVEPGEDINVGAVREVKEETGIDAEFVEVLAFRQSHKSFFDKSDLFFVCLLRPLSYDITKQDSEIEACQWMPIEEFAAQPFVQKHELVKYILEVGLAKVDKEYAGFSPISIKSAFTDKLSLFYMNRRDLDRASG
ncbi:nudix hydrolase 2 isoform X3 [Sorghum bicolor]|uniref:Nudix hydrolase domain-containing protein n=1 Tax=Sorghum bicolor TaxID=4558 RepID=A0A1W0VU15_SORBI|nr:nudix hydrolase 2 isoform X3 [Sorghum bicolor]OQU76744.1 hypothetical protein SORBI_3010G199600 [Sorghum bicolor]|eukprot:XP_021304932.1 nudix hydrolase 2 isoform X3 [Sorghum bicolor]